MNTCTAQSKSPALHDPRWVFCSDRQPQSSDWPVWVDGHGCDEDEGVFLATCSAAVPELSGRGRRYPRWLSVETANRPIDIKDHKPVVPCWIFWRDEREVCQGWNHFGSISSFVGPLSPLYTHWLPGEAHDKPTVVPSTKLFTRRSSDQVRVEIPSGYRELERGEAILPADQFYNFSAWYSRERDMDMIGKRYGVDYTLPTIRKIEEAKSSTTNPPRPMPAAAPSCAPARDVATTCSPKPAAIEPGAGYRLLRDDEIIRNGDEIGSASCGVASGIWCPVGSTIGSSVQAENQDTTGNYRYIFRRPLADPKDQKIAELQAQLASARMETAEVRRQLNAEYADLQHECDELKETVGDIELQRDNLRTENAGLQTKIQQCERSIDNQDKEIIGLEKRNAEQAKTLNALLDLVPNSDRCCIQLVHDVQTLKNANGEALSRFKDEVTAALAPWVFAQSCGYASLSITEKVNRCAKECEQLRGFRIEACKARDLAESRLIAANRRIQELESKVVNNTANRGELEARRADAIAVRSTLEGIDPQLAAYYTLPGLANRAANRIREFESHQKNWHKLYAASKFARNIVGSDHLPGSGYYYAHAALKEAIEACTAPVPAPAADLCCGIHS